MGGALIIDTDVLIWYYRGVEKAKQALIDATPFSVSAVTYIELLQGARDKNELNKIVNDVNGWNVSVLDITEQISKRSIDLIKQYALSEGLMLADALIAATAIEYDKRILTGNSKHYARLSGVRIAPFKLGERS
jgi:predicted nucleic acid-binding protein